MEKTRGFDRLAKVGSLNETLNKVEEKPIAEKEFKSQTIK